MKKRLAIQLYGHVRTFEYTSKNFFKNIVNPNLKDGYKVDIFFYTWNEFNRKTKSWHDHDISFPTMNNKKLSQNDITTLLKIYNPKLYEISELPENEHGMLASYNKGRELRKKYEKMMNIKYDIILTTRFDMLFHKEMSIDYYLNLYKNGELSHFPLSNRFCFFSTSLFRLGVIDFRYINEGTLFFFSNSDIEYNEAYTETDNLLKIILSYNVLSEYDILRESQVLKVNNKNKPSNQTDKNHYRKAKSRIQNHLSYKLGQALIENSKSILGYIRMPYVLLYIKDKHKFEQKAYEEKIKENPNLALPPLETYPDYNEALKEKECFTYKLGEALIQASKNWYGGGISNLHSKMCLG
ncbi:hypothetical protein [Campylobacter jejuni]|uniref:hypothetical protein n=1 Tax=Campylobacter jejuni TaxID=197 RepID=UPI001BC6D5B7|nr:hypothetical protein [Campylobacter jejuni]CAG2536204.1 hypothetical protein NVI_CJUN_00070 [Campylobacter jejuni subsp. jejuni]